MKFSSQFFIKNSSFFSKVLLGGCLSSTFYTQQRRNSIFLETKQQQQYQHQFQNPYLPTNPDERQFISENDIEVGISKLFFYTELSEFSQMKIFAGSASKELAREIVAHLDLSLGRLSTRIDDNSEISINVLDNVNGKEVFLIQSMSPPNISDNLIELILLIARMKRYGASKVTCIIPYFAYSRQSSIDNNDSEFDRESISASSICQLIQAAGADRIVTINFNSRINKGFFSPQVPCLNIDVVELIIPYFLNKNLQNPVLIGAQSQNTKGEKMQQLQDSFQIFDIPVNLGFMTLKDKENYEYIGEDVKDKDCIIISDMIDQGKNLKKFSDIMEKLGAKHVYFFAPHGLFSIGCIKNIKHAKHIQEVLVTNTLQGPDMDHEKIKIISVGKLLASVITSLNRGIHLNAFRESRSLLKYVCNVDMENKEIQHNIVAEYYNQQQKEYLNSQDSQSDNHYFTDKQFDQPQHYYQDENNSS